MSQKILELAQACETAIASWLKERIAQQESLQGECQQSVVLHQAKLSYYSETISLPEDDEFIASHVKVYTDGKGYFISIETDSYEGHTMITLPVARLLRGALDRAIAASKKERESNG